MLVNITLPQESNKEQESRNIMKNILLTSMFIVSTKHESQHPFGQQDTHNA